MARLPDETVTRIKQEVSLVRLAEARGFELKPHGSHYANRTLAYRLPASNRQEGAEIRGRLKEIGILRASTGHEHFNGCLVAPVMDENGVITEVYGRKLLGKRLRKDCAQHLFLPGPHEVVWNSQAVKQSKELILCESLIDAMTFWANGFRHVTTSYGTAGFTDELLTLLVNGGVEKVLIAYDRDEAGNRAAEKLAEKLNDNGMDAYRVLFPKGMEANEYTLQVTPAPKSLGLALRKAEWMGSAKNKPELNGVSEPAPQPEALANLGEPQSLPPLVANTLAAESPVENPAALDAEIAEHEINIKLAPRHYRIRGLNKNLSYEQLKINLLIQQNEVFHVDTFDLYSAKARTVYIKQAAEELGILAGEIKADLGRMRVAPVSHTANYLGVCA
jgi:DNA primase